MQTHTFWQRLAFPWYRREPLSAQAIGVIAVVVMIISSSTYNVFAKVLTGSLSPITLVFLSEALTAFFVLLSFGTVPTMRKMWRLSRRDVLPIVAVSFLCGIAGPLIWFFGLENSSAINASLFGNGEMVFLWFFAVVFLHERFTKKHMLSVVTIIAGLLVIALKGFTEGLELHGGDGLLMLSCASYGAGGIVFRKYLNRVEPHLVLLGRSVGAVAAFFLISPFLSHPLIDEIRAFPLALVPALLGFGFISRFLNVFSFYESMEHLDVTTVSLCLNFTVIGSILFAALSLGEMMEPYHYAGGILIIAGALMLELAGTHSTKKHLERHLRHGNLRRL